MKRELLNSNNLQNRMVDQNKEAREIYELIQKVGKGKRRHQLTLSKANKKVIYKMMKEMSNMMSSQGAIGKNFQEFLSHLESESKFGKNFRVSYEELTLLRKVISLSMKELMHNQLKWYQLLKRFSMYVMLAQYRNLLKVLNV